MSGDDGGLEHAAALDVDEGDVGAGLDPGALEAGVLLDARGELVSEGLEEVELGEVAGDAHVAPEALGVGGDDDGADSFLGDDVAEEVAAGDKDEVDGPVVGADDVSGAEGPVGDADGADAAGLADEAAVEVAVEIDGVDAAVGDVGGAGDLVVAWDGDDAAGADGSGDGLGDAEVGVDLPVGSGDGVEVPRDVDDAGAAGLVELADVAAGGDEHDVGGEVGRR